MELERNSGSEIMDILLLTDRSYHFSQKNRDFEILFVLAGNVLVGVDREQKQIGANQILAINPDTERSYTVGENSIAAIFIISRIKLWRMAIGRPIQLKCDSASDGSSSYDNLRSMLRKAISLHLQDTIFDKLDKHSCFYNILHEIIRKYSNWDISGSADQASEYDIRKLAILDYIHSNFSKQISLTDLAKALNLSPSYLSKYIKSAVGVGFLDLLNHTRLEYAIDDLLRTDMHISKIAIENGFPNFSSFNRVFREVYQMSPTEFRKRNKPIRISNTNTELQKSRKIFRAFLKEDDEAPINSEASALVYEADAGKAAHWKKYWNEGYSLGPAHFLQNSDVQNHVLMLKKEYHFAYLHISRIFCKELLIDLDATDSYNFSRVFRILDFLVENEIVPSIDIGFQPWGLIKKANSEVLYEDYDLRNLSIEKYKALIDHFIKQSVHRYGEEEVVKWRFDLFHNTINPIADESHPYLSYISYFSAAYSCIKRILPSAKVGGSRTYTYDVSEFQQLVSAFSREKITPDFFSVQIYPYSLIKVQPNEAAISGLERTGQHFEPSSDESYLFRKILQLREILVNSGFQPDSLTVSGWNFSLSCGNFLNDSCYKGAYIVRTLLSCLGQTGCMTYEGISDLLYEYYSPSLQLYGGYGLISKDGIRKPAYYAFAFMNQLGDYLISAGSNYIITKDSHDRIFIVCHNCGTLTPEYFGRFHDDAGYQDVAALTEQGSISMTLRISGLSQRRYQVKKFIVGENEGSVLNEWIRLGYLENIGRDEIDYLAKICVPRQHSDLLETQNNAISVPVFLTKNEFQLIKILPV